MAAPSQRARPTLRAHLLALADTRPGWLFTRPQAVACTASVWAPWGYTPEQADAAVRDVLRAAFAARELEQVLVEGGGRHPRYRRPGSALLGAPTAARVARRSRQRRALQPARALLTDLHRTRRDALPGAPPARVWRCRRRGVAAGAG
jgi:hypothetical protein